MTSRFILNRRLVESSTANPSTISQGEPRSEVRFQRPSLLGNVGSLLDVDGENEWEPDTNIDEAEDGLVWASGSMIGVAQESGDYHAVRISDPYEVARGPGHGIDEEVRSLARKVAQT